MRAADGILRRIVVLFSCGAASTVAGKLALESAPPGVPVVFMNNHVREEHSDNERYLRDCEKWYGQPILSSMNEKYDGSIYRVFESRRFIKSRDGAPCTKYLKRELRDRDLRPGDRVVLGYTSEERERLDQFIDINPHIDAWAPLIDFGLNKSDCLAMVQRAGIEIPTMYKLGYNNNNNCIGCVKGGIGYWNKIRVDFPETFERMANLEQKLGKGAFLFKPIRKGEPRRSLRDIQPHEGRMSDEPDIQCGVMCDLLTHNSDWYEE